MENSPNLFAEAEPRTYWPMARAANADLLVESMPRVNLLLTGTDDLIESALRTLMPSLRGPIAIWTSRAPFQIPTPLQAGTIIVRDIDVLSAFDQYRLLKWLEQPNLRTRIISTTTTPLLERLELGTFDPALYFRLNVACVDLTE